MSNLAYDSIIFVSILAYGWWIGSIWIKELKRLKSIDTKQKQVAKSCQSILNKY